MNTKYTKAQIRRTKKSHQTSLNYYDMEILDFGDLSSDDEPQKKRKTEHFPEHSKKNLAIDWTKRISWQTNVFPDEVFEVFSKYLLEKYQIPTTGSEFRNYFKGRQ